MKETVSFQSNGSKCAAWLFTPESEGPFPIIVMAHGLAGTMGLRLDAYAERFAAAGYACLLFDYRHFGDSEGQPRQILDINKQLDDWLAAIAYARSLASVDASQLALWGTSLSGGHVLKIASLVSDVKAVISQVPHLSGPASLGLNSLSKIMRLSLHGAYDAARGALGLAPHYIQASAEPDQLAIMNAPGESKAYLALVPAGQKFDGRVAARFALSIGLYSPIATLKKLQMPILMQVATNDVTTPAKPAIKVSDKLANITLKKYETGHFQPYIEPMFSVIIGDQLAFLDAQFKK